MRKVALIGCLMAFAAWAGDKYIGTIVSTGTSVNQGSVNLSVPPGSKLTVQCDAISYINTDTKTAVSSANGLKVQADQAWQTSVGYQVVMADGGVPSAIVNVISASGTSNCKVFQRLGTE